MMVLPFSPSVQQYITSEIVDGWYTSKYGFCIETAKQIKVRNLLEKKRSMQFKLKPTPFNFVNNNSC
jgi:hypothetical protein